MATKLTDDQKRARARKRAGLRADTLGIGVYAIRAPSGNGYIGSSNACEKRIKRHYKSLRAGTHHCVSLQRAFDKYGSRLEFEMVQEFSVAEYRRDSDILHDAEQDWIDDFDGSLYNSTKYVRGPARDPRVGAKIGLAHTGMKRTQQTCNNISRSLKGRSLSESHKLAIGARVAGDKNPSYFHGMSGKGHMLGSYRRCLYGVKRPGHAYYKCYGAKGIGMCPEWLQGGREGVIAFIAWNDSLSQKLRWEKGLRLGRKDVRGDFTPDNCVWMTDEAMKQSFVGNNPKAERHSVDGTALTLKQMCERYGCSMFKLRYRLKQGFPAKEAIVLASATHHQQLRKAA